MTLKIIFHLKSHSIFDPWMKAKNNCSGFVSTSNKIFLNDIIDLKVTDLIDLYGNTPPLSHLFHTFTTLDICKSHFEINMYIYKSTTVNGN